MGSCLTMKVLEEETFVTRKITRGLANIAMGLQSKLQLGNLNSERDWGHAKDYVEMQYLMLQQKGIRTLSLPRENNTPCANSWYGPQNIWV